MHRPSHASCSAYKDTSRIGSGTHLNFAASLKAHLRMQSHWGLTFSILSLEGWFGPLQEGVLPSPTVPVTSTLPWAPQACSIRPPKQPLPQGCSCPDCSETPSSFWDWPAPEGYGFLVGFSMCPQARAEEHW